MLHVATGLPQQMVTSLACLLMNYHRRLSLRAVLLADDLGDDLFWIPEASGSEIFTLPTDRVLHTQRIARRRVAKRGGRCGP